MAAPRAIPKLCFQGYAFVLFLQLGILAVIIATFTHPNWVSQGSGDFEWTGSLRKCSFCHGRFAEKTYSQLSAEECGNSPQSNTCVLFADLNNAFDTFLVLELITLALLVFWIFRVLLHIFRKPFFHDCFVFLIPLIMTMLQMIGYTVWAAIARSGFHENCSDWDISYYSDVRGPLCNEEGPQLAFANGLVMVGSTIIYYFVYMNEVKSKVYTARNYVAAPSQESLED